MIPSMLISSYADLARDCAMIGELSQAKMYCQNMQIGIDSNQTTMLEMTGLIAWISYHQASGQCDLALDETTALMELREESINEGNIAEQTAQKMDFEFEKERLVSEKEIELQTKSIATEKAYSSKLGIGLVILVALLIGFAYLFYANFKKRKTISKQNIRLNDSVEEKEMLLKEIHHRVKNNLQLVSSLLSLQSDSMEDDQAINVLEEGQNRVQAMALIHQKLYQNDKASEIDFTDYLNSLVGHFDQVNPINKKVDFAIECEDINLDIDTAIPLGLIINEFFTNAFKHAFKEVELPQLSVSIKKIAAGEFTMKLADNGKGLPEELDWNKTKTLGLRLMRSLVKQLIGKMQYENHSNLSVFSIQFKNQFGRNLLE